MSAVIKIVLSEKLYVRDPELTELGKKIVTESIHMIDEVGLEQFTFKKLATKLNSTEASVYRYFESKHKLLVYLISWYWVWLDYQIGYWTNNIKDPRKKLKIIIKIISRSGHRDNTYTHIDEAALFRIAVAESSKTYLTKDVDTDNKKGLFLEYNALCRKIGAVVSDINPDYPYPHALVSTLFEAGKKQIFFAQHLPALTEAQVEGENFSSIATFLTNLAFSSIDSTIAEIHETA